MNVLRIAVGSVRSAKLLAVRAACARISEVDPGWDRAEIVAREVETNAPAMPLTDSQLMRGARERALAVRKLLRHEGVPAHLYVGLEGGFHTVTLDGERHTFLQGWAYATDGKRGHFGISPSVSVPAQIVREVVVGRRELGEVIDEVAGERDVRSRQGAWGVISKELLTRAQSFESALVAAFAPFYNAELFESTQHSAVSRQPKR
ncbi:MAG TPA: inosine/xanthosine triphosphatase [Pyrinomonadaceae bacterium]|jgi:inosine/xanthosine triphosphatase|nr:inosine/xanthosine triphosphatase [Pyrinomonadaceae bacterium]